MTSKKIRGTSPTNRSLERGIDVLRAFKPGSDLLGNGELAERTGLSRATVSRLTQTLVRCGFLQAAHAHRAYRLAPSVLSLAHAMRTGSRVLQAAAPPMRAVAESRKINVGLAAPDREEMVYLESIRYAKRASQRHVVSGQRVPMELTSLGRAYLATLDEAAIVPLLASLEHRRGAQWAALYADIQAARQSVRELGYCAAAWQPEVVAIAAPLEVDQDVYVVNISLSTTDSMESTVEMLAPCLLRLTAEIRQTLASDVSIL